LHQILLQLDAYSLETQRPITLPLLRTLLTEQEHDQQLTLQ